jgi:hypothetical protein
MIRFLVVAFMLLFMMPAVVQAQGIDLDKIPETPKYEIPQAEFEAKTDLIKAVPFGDKFLAHEMRIPKNWKKVELEVEGGSTQRILGDAAKFIGPTLLDSPSYFVLRAANIDYDMTVRNWFINFVLTNGYVLQAMRETSDHRIDALFVMVERDVSYLVRAAVKFNGSRIVIAMYFLPETRWQEERAMQSMVMDSFVFTEPAPRIGEERESYAFLDLIRFDFPRSWRLEAPNIFSTESMDAKLINTKDEKTLNGEIRISVVSTEADTTLADEIKNTQNSLSERSMAIGEMLPLVQDYKLYDHFTFSRIESYKVNSTASRMLDYEYWIGVMVEDRYFYIVTLLTPSRNADFSVWARNIEAFRIVLQTMRL